MRGRRGGEGHVLLLGAGLHVVHVLKHRTTRCRYCQHPSLFAATLEKLIHTTTCPNAQQAPYPIITHDKTNSVYRANIVLISTYISIISTYIFIVKQSSVSVVGTTP